MDNQGHLENTIIRFFSDHGDHINPVALKSVSGLTERFNPFLFIAIPGHLKDKIGSNIEKNTQKLVTAYDFFSSDLALWGLLGQKEHDYGQDLYFQEIPDSRTCESAQLYDAKATCKCFSKAEMKEYKNNLANGKPKKK